MVFWKGQGLNEVADNPNNLSDGAVSKKVTEKINTGGTGEDERKAYFTKLKSGL